MDDSHALVGAVPILVLDIYEHAYHIEFGANAAAYIDASMRLIDWTVGAERLMEATCNGRGAERTRVERRSPPSLSRSSGP